jgi:hypothetical protein
MNFTKRLGLGFLFLLCGYVLLGMYGNAQRLSNSQSIMTNNLFGGYQAPPVSSTIYPNNQIQALSPQLPSGIQVVRSLLGLEVNFANGHVTYPGPMITNDARYQALSSQEKLVDAIMFRPQNIPPFLLLVAIAKNANAAPTIVPGKFDIVQNTQQNGFVLSDSHKRLFYYSGYVLATSQWQNLPLGQSLTDQFCKDLVPLTMCSPQKVVNVVLRKSLDPRKDIPLFELVQ